MEIYDDLIGKCLDLLEKEPEFHKVNVTEEDASWAAETAQKLIFQKDMAYELGGNGKPAISGVGYTTRDAFESGVWLLGADLPDLQADTSYARITILNVDDSEFADQNAAYRALEKMDYTRYHIYPEGFMIRISTSAKREPVRVSRQALKKGLNFAKVGKIFLDGYMKHEKVNGVKQIFVTKPDFHYEELEQIVQQMEGVTASLNKIYKNLIMDCRSCNLKAICDEVEGIRELHERVTGFPENGK